MTNEEILRKAIEKAIKNGWKHETWGTSTEDILYCLFKSFEDQIAEEEILFDPSFAYAFFGHKPMMMGEIKEQGKWSLPWQEGDVMLSWAGTFADFNLMKLAITREEDRIKYLEKFL